MILTCQASTRSILSDINPVCTGTFPLPLPATHEIMALDGREGELAGEVIPPMAEKI